MNVLALSVSINLQFLHQFLNFVGFFFVLLLEEHLQPKDIQFFNTVSQYTVYLPFIEYAILMNMCQKEYCIGLISRLLFLKFDP